MAISSLFAAQRRPDSIDAVFASLPMGDAMRGTVSTGGLANATFISEWMSITHLLSTLNAVTGLANPQFIPQLFGATNDHIQQIDSYHLPLINATLNGDPTYTYDSDFWRLRSPIEQIDKIKAPTFIVGGLNDIFQRDEPLLYERLKANGVDTRLALFNTTHLEGFLLPHFATEQLPAIDYLMLQWFDKYLKAMDTGIESIPAVVQQVKNYPTPSTPAEFQNDNFATTTDWPHPLAIPERWYLHGDMRLSQSAPVAVETSVQMTNPEHPVGRAFKENGLLVFEVELNDGTLCSRSYEQWVLGIALPRSCYNNTKRSKQQRLVFDSGVMEEDYYINGPIQADIWIESTAAEAVVAVQIEEVSRKRSQPITNGQLLASVRAVNVERSRFLEGEMIQPYHYFTEDKSQLLVPGEVVKMQVEIFPTSAIIRKGNRLRIAISPSNQAQGVLNYPRQTLAEDGVTTIHISDAYPSSIVLPIVPVSALN